MNEFLVTALTFPTLVYSILLGFCVVYWLLASFGLFDVDLDGMHAHVHADGDVGETSMLAGLFARLGLGGVPIMLVLAVLSFFGWIITYFVHLLLLSHLPDALRLPAGVVLLLLALAPGVLMTSLLLRPVRKLIVKLRPPMAASLLGKVGTVISPEVNERDGRASVADGGAGLILQVRAPAGQRYPRDARVVILAHDPTHHCYSVIAESEFNRR